MLALYLAAGAAALCVALYAYLRYRLTHWKRLGVAYVNPSVPFGNYAPVVLGKIGFAQVPLDIYREYRSHRYIGTYFLATPLLQLHDPDIINSVFIKEFHDFNGRGMDMDPENDPLAAHLFVLSGQPWRNLRVKLSPTFTTGKIKYMFKTFHECGQHLRDHVVSSMKANGGAYEEDVRELVARFSTDIISSVAFGIESNSMKDPNSEFRRMGQLVFAENFNTSIRVLLLFFAGNLMKRLRIRSVTPVVHNFFTRIVREMVSYRESNGVERADMLNLLLKLKNEGFIPPDHADDREAADTGSANGVEASTEARLRITEKQIAAQVFVFFVAGFETTSSTSSFTLFELARNPDIQEKVIAEVDAVLKKHAGNVTYETLMDMPYLDMVIQETLRMWPAVPFLTREAMVRRQLPLTDVMLEKGTRLLIPVNALHRDPKYWPEPDRYDPLRFTEEAKRTRPAGVYIPFGNGPRICIGMRMAQVQVKMALVTILSQCRLSLGPNMRGDPKLSARTVVPTPIGGVKLILTARQ